MTMLEYAEKEWNRTFPPDKSDEIQNWCKENVMELLKTFSNQGHSAMSGNYVLHIFYKLARYIPLSPLTGEDDEWHDCHGSDDDLQQNNRYSAVFRRNHDNATAYNIEGRVFVDKDGISYTNRDSRVPVTFPYTVPERPEVVKIEHDETERLQ